MSKKNRIVAILLAVTVLFVMLFSVCYIAAEANHDCTGEDCPICCQISLCENTLKSLGNAIAIVIVAAFIGAFMLFLPTFSKKQVVHITLVSLKVKLSN